MKKSLILLALAAASPLTMTAQDDMYFVPTKKNVEKEKKTYGMPKDTYYSGSNRSIDDYNRRNRTECWEVELKDGSEVVMIDSLGNSLDTICVNSKSKMRLQTENNDYEYTRRMARWDGYEASNAYWHGYTDGRFGRWYGWSTFYDPWYYSSWYGPYGGWYDPWYYGYSGWYGGWYGWRPYYSYYDWGWGWHGHYYPVYGGGGRYYGTGRAGTANHSGSSYGRPASAFGSGRSISSGIANRDRSRTITTKFGTSNRYNSNRNTTYQRNDVNTSNRNQTYNRGNNSSFSGSHSGSSFGGSRSGGSFGGSRSGGGSFGGRRR